MPKYPILDKEKRLSESLLWSLQDAAYSGFGPTAWSEKGVPFYVTSNPWTAKAYAQMVLGYLRDQRINPKEPLYLFDLGAGSGRFAFLFLKEFFTLIKGLPFEKWNICYVMTDFAKKNIVYWQKHPLLKPYFANGVLDCCLYHHANTDGLELLVSKKSLIKVKNPIIVMANYFFDTIPQDFFRVKEGQLEEGLITLSTGKKWKDKKDPDLINDLKFTYSYKKAKKTYSNSQWEKFLKHYQKSFQNSFFLFPIGAFQVIDYFYNFSKGNLLLLAGDQGFSTKKQVTAASEPQISLHGSFSIAVSYHAISEYIKFKGGDSLLTSMPNPSFVVLGGIFPNGNFPETLLAFNTFINAFEPRDYWRLSLEAEKNDPSLEMLLLLIKLGNYDPMTLYGCFEKIRAKLKSATPQNKEDLKVILEMVWQKFYPVGKGDTAFAYVLGTLYHDLNEIGKAYKFFEKAKS